MTRSPDDTNDATLRSWLESANDPEGDFPIQNLPFGVFRHDGRARVGVAIGDRVIDVSAMGSAGLHDLALRSHEACAAPSLNALMSLGPDAQRALRQALSRALRNSADAVQRAAVEKALFSMKEIEMLLPAEIGDYTDFYASVHHATNVGSMFRPENPLLPNYKYVPIGYHGRASSIVPSGTDIRRPLGQTREEGKDPVYGPTSRLDYECEVGVFVGEGNSMGEIIPIHKAEQHVFGLCLLNDWSARDVQAWEYQPLGPFLAKNFASTISPWVITMDALAPFRAAAFARPESDPAPLPYLADSALATTGGIEITLDVFLRTERMRSAGVPPHRLSRARFTDMYWTVAQLVAHHASNGCNLRPGDLLGSGTISGAGPDERGCLLELAWRGSQPVQLPGGETRAFLHDGDEVIMRGYCARDGAARIGFGECAGTVMPAPAT